MTVTQEIRKHLPMVKIIMASNITNAAPDTPNKEDGN